MKKLLRAKFVAVFLLFSQMPFCASAVELMVWSTGRGGPKLILPMSDGGDRQETAVRYLENLYDSEALGPAMRSEWISKFHGSFSDFPSPGGKPIMALVDNSFERHEDDLATFKRGGADVYLVPMGAELAVRSAADRAEFRKKLSKSVDGLVLLGGADIDPHFYGSRPHGAVHYNRKRDEMEYELIKAFLAQRSGKLFGICRGQQMIAAALGYKLYQDIPDDLDVEGHDEGTHVIDITKGSLLSKMLGGKTSANVNTLHHQSVNISSKPQGPLKVTAVVTDNDVEVVEALESRNGRIFTVQFHPELMNGSVASAVIRGMVKLAKGSCSGDLSALAD